MCASSIHPGTLYWGSFQTRLPVLSRAIQSLPENRRLAASLARMTNPLHLPRFYRISPIARLNSAHLLLKPSRSTARYILSSSSQKNSLPS